MLLTYHHLKTYFNRIREALGRGLPNEQGSIGNATWSLASYVAYMLILLVTTPLLLRWLGTGGYGILVLVNSALGFSGAFDLGLTVSITKYVSTFRAKGDDDAVSEVVSIGSWIFLGLGLILAVALFFIAPGLAALVNRNDLTMVPIAATSFRIGSVGVVAKFVDSIGLSIIQGYQRYDISSKLNLATSSSAAVVSVILAWYGLGPVGCVTGVAICVSVGALAKLFVANKLVGGNRLWRRFRKTEVFQQVFRFGIWGWIHGVGGLLASQADKFLVSGMLGSRELSIYAVCSQVAQQVHALPSNALSFLFPLSASVQQSHRLADLQRMYFRAQRIAISFGSMIGVSLGIMAFPFLSLWMGEPFANSASATLTLFAFYFTLLSTTIVPYNFLLGTGHVRLNTIFGVIGNALMLIGLVLLIPRAGVVGAVWAKILSFSVGIILFPILHRRVLADYRRGIGLRLFAPIVLPFSLILWLTPLPAMGFAAFAVISLALATAAAGVAFTITPRDIRQDANPLHGGK